MNESEIRSQLVSNDLAVLQQSLNFANDKLTLERARSAKAEARSTTVFAVTGIMAGFIVQFSKLLSSLSQNKGLAISLYIISILFLIKAALFALRSLWSLQGNEVSEKLIFDLQKLQESEAIREETIWKIWEYYQLLPLTNWRLFYTDQSQRNLFAAIISFAAFSATWFLGQSGIQLPKIVSLFVAIPIFIAVFFLEWAFNRFSKFWQFND